MRCLVQFFESFLIVAKILLAPNKDYWKSGAEVEDFGDPLDKFIISATQAEPYRNVFVHPAERAYLLLHVVKGIRRVDRETDEDDMGLRIR